MFFLAGSAASSALDLISALQQTLTGQNSSTPPASSQNFDLGADGAATAGASSTTAASPLAPATMSALLSVQGNGQTLVNGDAFSAKLFGMIDGNGDGNISQSEFDAIFGKNGDTTKADALFARLDANHDGNVTPGELTNALSGQGQDGWDAAVRAHPGHHFFDGASALTNGNPNDLFSSNPSNNPFGIDQNETVTNPDGSTTTTITFGDGSQVSMTRPAPSGAAANPAANPTAWAHNTIERLIQRQMQMMAASSSFAISA
jgi:EF hand domain-containing protein